MLHVEVDRGWSGAWTQNQKDGGPTPGFGFFVGMRTGIGTGAGGPTP